MIGLALMDMSPLLSSGFSINSLKSGLSTGFDRISALAGREMEHNNTKWKNWKRREDIRILGWNDRSS